MSAYMYMVIWSLLTVSIRVDTTDGVIVQEVNVGHLAELPCPSIDDQHRFMYWELADTTKVLGPGNPFNENKYNYEVLTGKLMIRGVSTAESGFYRCVSQGIKDSSDFSIRYVELIVKKDSEDTLDRDFQTKLVGGIAVITVLVVVAVAVLFIIIIRRKRHRFFEMDESRENSPARYRGDLHNVSSGVNDARATSDTEGIDNLGLDDDFPKVFKLMQKEQALP